MKGIQSRMVSWLNLKYSTEKERERKQKKLSKREQRRKTLRRERRKLHSLGLRERLKRKILERGIVPCGVLVGGLAFEEITALIGKKSSVAGG